VLGAVATATASAQVYSVNAVGYVNVTVPKGFTLIANPLKAATNTVGALFASAPDGTTLYTLKADGTYDINTKDFGEWGNPNAPLEPGQGAFILNAGNDAFTVTFVGEVMQGKGASALKNPLPKGFSIRSSMVPQSGQLDKDLGFPAADGDTIYFWKNASTSYGIHTFDFGAWDTPPVPAVGEAFYVNKVAAVDWVREFSVNP
jgi:hypothetical protein